MCDFTGRAESSERGMSPERMCPNLERYRLRGKGNAVRRAARSRNQGNGCYVWRPPGYAAASVAVQSRWGNLYDAPAAVRSLAVDVDGPARVDARLSAPAETLVADRLPGRSLRLRVPGLPVPPFRGCYPMLLGLGAVTELVMARVSLTPRLDGAGDGMGDGMHVLINAAAPGTLFGLAHSQAGRPPNVVRRAAREIRLFVDATVVRLSH